MIPDQRLPQAPINNQSIQDVLEQALQRAEGGRLRVDQTTGPILIDDQQPTQSQRSQRTKRKTVACKQFNCDKHVEELMSQYRNKQPQIKLDPIDIYSDNSSDNSDANDDFALSETSKPPVSEMSRILKPKDTVTHFECLICKNVPVSPVECPKCDVIICSQCKCRHDQGQDPDRRRCPQCLQKVHGWKAMNRNIRMLTLEQIKFRHRCLDDESDISDCDFDPKHPFGHGLDSNTMSSLRILKRRKKDSCDEVVTKTCAIDKFKKTEAYKKILEKMGKTPVQNSSQGQDQSGRKKASINMHVKRRRRWLSKDKLYSYDEYIQHLKSGTCYKKNFFVECPLKCGLGGDEICQKMPLSALSQHLQNECPFVEHICQVCGLAKKRSELKRHSKKTCAKQLQEKYDTARKQITDLRNEKLTLLKNLLTLSNDGLKLEDNCSLGEIYSKLEDRIDLGQACRFGRREIDYEGVFGGMDDEQLNRALASGTLFS